MNIKLNLAVDAFNKQQLFYSFSLDEKIFYGILKNIDNLYWLYKVEDPENLNFNTEYIYKNADLNEVFKHVYILNELKEL